MHAGELVHRLGEGSAIANVNHSNQIIHSTLLAVRRPLPSTILYIYQGIGPYARIRPDVAPAASTEPGFDASAPRRRPIVGSAVAHPLKPLKPLERLGEHRQRRRAQLIVVPRQLRREQPVRLRIQCLFFARNATLERRVDAAFGGVIVHTCTKGTTPPYRAIRYPSKK
ncbi:hypothetical protein [Burkholderia ubonensis]|uniref:hypothetical protein n=1 Tax=Burkholderia ubonensis TaxID=101571 RepID=UPI0012F801D1|nr:hypothetical protein [Burkholderia ubonensis]